MTVHEETIAKIRQLPEPLLQEVNDFIDFILMKHYSDALTALPLRYRWQLWTQFTESLEIADADFSDYLSNLEDYETRLARGEIQW
jgi:hypothetical protein